MIDRIANSLMVALGQSVPQTDEDWAVAEAEYAQVCVVEYGEEPWW